MVIRKRVYDGKLSLTDAQKAFAGLDKITVQLITHPNLFASLSGYFVNRRQRAREIAEQFNQRTVYDATYAALAEFHGCEFWTADKMFYDSVKATLLFVKYLPDYP